MAERPISSYADFQSIAVDQLHFEVKTPGAQLQRSRRPDLYIMKDLEFEEFKTVILEQKGPRILPEQTDWDEIIARNADAAKAAHRGCYDTAGRAPRPGQQAFRRDLLNYYGCAVEEALEAAHIIPWTGDADLDRRENGLLLRRDIHGLFDAGLLRINPKSSLIELAAKLDKTDYDNYRAQLVAHRAEPKLLEVRYALTMQTV